MAEISSFPNNQDEYYGAEDVMRWLHGRTKGVYAGANNAAVSAVQGAMAVSVSPGIGWMTDHNGDGICWWFKTALELSIEPSESSGVLNRIDRVVIEWQTGDYSHRPEVKVLTGTNSSSPTPPALTNNNVLRQISLAQIYIQAATIQITNGMITDERQDPTVCGLVTETVTADTSVIQAQFESLFAQITSQSDTVLSSIEEAYAALEVAIEHGQYTDVLELRKRQFSNTVVPTSAFVADTTYEDFGYRAAVALAGVLAIDIPEVMFGMAEAISGNFAPVAVSYDGGVYIYAADVPDAAITIPTIICWRGNAT